MPPLASAIASTPIIGSIPTARRRHIREVLEQEPWCIRERRMDHEEEGGNRKIKKVNERESSQVHHLFRTRDNRKGRHAIEIVPIPHKPPPQGPPLQAAPTETYLTPPLTSSLPAVLHNLRTLLTTFPVYDISYLVSLTFVIGSAIWVVNGFFSWLPYYNPKTKFPGESTTGAGTTAMVGCVVFVVGSILLVVEAVNEDRSGCFGWIVEKTWEEEEQKMTFRLLGETRDGDRKDRPGCQHHHANRETLVGRGKSRNEDTDEIQKDTSKKLPIGASKKLQDASRINKDARSPPLPKEASKWIWFPTGAELRYHYLRDIGFMGSIAQLFGSIIFCISGFTAIPQIHNTLNHPTRAGVYGTYWFPQVLGSLGFVISSLLFMLETQEQWWKPNLKSLGWWVGFWNEIGSWGFLLCGSFGYWRGTGGEYQSSLSTFWGSWAFLLGSLVQWYESVQKFPVEKVKE